MKEQDPREKQEAFRLSREVRISELIAALAMISALATGYIELRLRPVEQAVRAQAEAQGEFKRELREDMRLVNGKLDRLIESIAPRR
jgi:hypothetical protein